MNTQIRKQLIDLARRKTTWSYSQLNEQLTLGYDFNIISHRDMIGDELGEISEFEFSKERPPLSVLITHGYEKREQGDGFYKMASKFYNRPWQDLKEDKKFESKLISDCFFFWRDKDNYIKFKDDIG